MLGPVCFGMSRPPPRENAIDGTVMNMNGGSKAPDPGFGRIVEPTKAHRVRTRQSRTTSRFCFPGVVRLPQHSGVGSGELAHRQLARGDVGFSCFRFKNSPARCLSAPSAQELRDKRSGPEDTSTVASGCWESARHPRICQGLEGQIARASASPRLVRHVLDSGDGFGSMLCDLDGACGLELAQTERM